VNYTTAVFLINKHVRALKATYESNDGAPQTVFKTLDPSIAVGDFVVVPTDTRHKMTVCKIVETDCDIDMDSPTAVAWIIGKVDREGYETTLKNEAQAVQQIKAAELRKKREDLANNLLANHLDTIKALPIAAMNGDKPAPVEVKA